MCGFFLFLFFVFLSPQMCTVKQAGQRRPELRVVQFEMYRNLTLHFVANNSLFCVSHKENGANFMAKCLMMNGPKCEI